MSDKRGLSGAFFIGAVLGGLAVLFMPEEKQKKGKKLIQDKAGQAKQGLISAYDSQQIQSIFGKDSEEVTQMFLDAKANLSDRLDRIKKKVASIDKKRYVKAVDDLIADLEKQDRMTSTQLKKLETYLKADFKKLTSK